MNLGEAVPIQTFADLGECAGAFDRATEGFAFEGFAELTVEDRVVYLNVTLAYDMGKCSEAKHCGCPVCPICKGEGAVPF